MKQAHVYIYGIIDIYQDDNISEWGYVNLKYVKNQLENQEGFEEIVLHIRSEGGDVNEGFAIHDFVRSQGKPVLTIIEGNCYSIATVIALAGDKRQMTSNAEILIHNPWGFVGGEKEDIQKYANDLEKIEDKIANFYAAKTNLNKEDALELMKVETIFNATEALEKGFITEIAAVMRAVAKYNPKNKSKKNNKMAKKQYLTQEEADKKFDSLGEKLNKVINKLFGKAAKNLVLQDANGDEIDFSDLEDGAEPQVGDTATVNNEPADGDYVMPDGRTFVFTAGELTEIKEADSTEEEAAAEVEALQTENTELKTQNEKLTADLAEAQKNMKSFAKDLKALKEEVSSSFNYDGKEDPKKTQNTKVRTASKFRIEK